MARVLDDPFALGSLGPASAAALMLDPDAHNDVSNRSLRAGIVARSRFAEDRLLRTIAAGGRQYAIVVLVGFAVLLLTNLLGTHGFRA